MYGRSDINENILKPCS